MLVTEDFGSCDLVQFRLLGQAARPPVAVALVSLVGRHHGIVLPLCAPNMRVSLLECDVTISLCRQRRTDRVILFEMLRDSPFT